MIRRVGTTEDGLPVFAGVQTLVGTHGVPLEVVLGLFKDKSMVVDWPDYVQAALNEGANPRTVRARIVSAVAEIYGPAYMAEVEKRLERYL